MINYVHHSTIILSPLPNLSRILFPPFFVVIFHIFCATSSDEAQLTGICSKLDNLNAANLL